MPPRWPTSPLWPRRDAARETAATFVNLFQPILNASLLNLPPRRYRATRGAEVVVASIGSHYAPRVALERTVSAIASARRAVLADRYPINSFAVEWRWFADLLTVADDWRDLAARAFEPNVFYEPAFALAAAAAFGRDAGAVLVWSGTSPRKLLGFFPARAFRHTGARPAADTATQTEHDQSRLPRFHPSVDLPFGDCPVPVK